MGRKTVKKELAFISILLACFVIIASGCHSTPQKVLGMDRQMKIRENDSFSIFITNNTAENRFEISYSFDDGSKNNSAYFTFYFSSTNPSIKSWHPALDSADDCPFTVTDDTGEKTVFDNNGCLSFTGEKVFYIIYKDSPEPVKNSFQTFIPSKNGVNDPDFSIYINNLLLVN